MSDHDHAHDHATRAEPTATAAPAADHGHDHGHGHAPPANPGRAFAAATALNLAFVVVEGAFGVAAGSMALLADAGHNLSDVMGLLLAWGATGLAMRAPTVRRSWGFRRSTILAALANALLTVAAGAIVLWESILRLRSPEPVEGLTVMAVAGVGIAVNALSAFLFWKGSKGDLNVRAAFQHLAADAAVSVGVVIAGGIVAATGLGWIDPVVGIVVSLVVLWTTWSVLRSALDLALDAAPAHIDVQGVRRWLSEQAGVRDVHDLHVWAVSTTEVALVAHLVIEEGAAEPDALVQVLRSRFQIGHATLQIERVACDGCGLTEAP